MIDVVVVAIVTYGHGISLYYWRNGEVHRPSFSMKNTQFLPQPGPSKMTGLHTMT